MQFYRRMSFESTEHIMRERVFSVTQTDFQKLCLEVFAFQYHNNPLYHSYCNLRQRQPERVHSITEIPFLPIRFFKQHLVQAGSFVPEMIFESSGTTGSVPSRHAVKSLNWYERSFIKTFHESYGDPSSWCILALLPSYLERQHSSLVYMSEKLIGMSNHPNSGFYLYEHDQLANTILKLEKEGQKTILLGVAFALLDFSDSFQYPLKHTTVIETGGMKGRKQEITKQALHEQLRDAWQLSSIHSEYGMTELISQAYSSGSGIFEAPNQLRICTRAEDDPTVITDISSLTDYPIRGGINIIDLHNLYTCCFIETEDYGTLYPNGKFQIDGRLDNSEMRGCGLMIT
jgi:hypothetical protein